MLPDDGIFSELLEPLNALDDSMLPSAIDALCDSLLSSNTPLFGHEFDCILSGASTDPWAPVPSSSTSLDFDDNSVLIRDCMWTSSSQEREPRVADLPTASFSDLSIDSLNVPGPSSCNSSSNNSSNSDSSQSDNSSEYIARNCAPYSIDNDHCYFIHRGYPEEQDSESDQEIAEEVVPEPSPKESESSETETSGDEVDIETIPEEKQSICSIRLQRTLSSTCRWSFTSRVPPPTPPAPPQRNRARKGRLDTAAVKAKLVHAKQLQQSGRCIARTIRRRRPGNSLNTSSGNSSDTEEPVKRRMHNSMERMRRQQQRSALYSLREQIPDLRNDFKAPKVKILEVGTAYIRHINKVTDSLVERKRKLLDKNRELKKRLEMMKNGQ